MVSRSILDPAPSLIWVIDTSLLIRFKYVVGVNDRWRLLTEMRECVISGEIAFPRQVASEMTDIKYPDAPGAWTADARHHVCHHEPTDVGVSQVLNVAPNLVNPDETNDAERADPYVVAMALELIAIYPDTTVVVASDDVVDRMPLKTSMKSACEGLSVEFRTVDEFLDWLRHRLGL